MLFVNTRRTNQTKGVAVGTCQRSSVVGRGGKVDAREFVGRCAGRRSLAECVLRKAGTAGNSAGAFANGRREKSRGLGARVDELDCLIDEYRVVAQPGFDGWCFGGAAIPFQLDWHRKKCLNGRIQALALENKDSPLARIAGQSLNLNSNVNVAIGAFGPAHTTTK